MSRRDDLYARASAALARGEAAQWEAAECMAQLYDLGEPQREIAARLGCSAMTVSRYLGVIAVTQGCKKRPSFTEAMAEVRGPRQQVEIPKAPERRAELVADLLKDKAVADAAVVRKVQERHSERRLRDEVRTFNKEHGIPTHTEREHDARRLSVVANDGAWLRLLGAIREANALLSDAIGQVERTGLPRSRSGEIIKATRTLRRTAERFETAATDAGIGEAM